ncbi:hypothetical protein C8R47DRAFT_1202699, partial [Mycena vitilis]
MYTNGENQGRKTRRKSHATPRNESITGKKRKSLGPDAPVPHTASPPPSHTAPPYPKENAITESFLQNKKPKRELGLPHHALAVPNGYDECAISEVSTASPESTPRPRPPKDETTKGKGNDMRTQSESTVDAVHLPNIPAPLPLVPRRAASASADITRHIVEGSRTMSKCCNATSALPKHEPERETWRNGGPRHAAASGGGRGSNALDDETKDEQIGQRNAAEKEGRQSKKESIVEEIAARALPGPYTRGFEAKASLALDLLVFYRGIQEEERKQGRGKAGEDKAPGLMRVKERGSRGDVTNFRSRPGYGVTEKRGPSSDSTGGSWVKYAAALALTPRSSFSDQGFNPVHCSGQPNDVKRRKWKSNAHRTASTGCAYLLSQTFIVFMSWAYTSREHNTAFEGCLISLHEEPAPWIEGNLHHPMLLFIRDKVDSNCSGPFASIGDAFFNGSPVGDIRISGGNPAVQCKFCVEFVVFNFCAETLARAEPVTRMKPASLIFPRFDYGLTELKGLLGASIKSRNNLRTRSLTTSVRYVGRLLS